MPCNPRHVECPDCGQNVWQFRSKRLEKDYYCDTNSHRNYHVCPDEPQEVALPTPPTPVPVLKVKPKVEDAGNIGLYQPGSIPIIGPDQIHEGRIVERIPFKEEPKDPMALEDLPEFKTAEDELKFQQGFRLLEIRISKGRRVGNEVIPELPEYRHFDYFQSRNIAVDNPDMDVADLIRRQYLEIDTTVTEQIAQDRAKVIKALDAQQRK